MAEEAAGSSVADDPMHVDGGGERALQTLSQSTLLQPAAPVDYDDGISDAAMAAALDAAAVPTPEQLERGRANKAVAQAKLAAKASSARVHATVIEDELSDAAMLAALEAAERGHDEAAATNAIAQFLEVQLDPHEEWHNGFVYRAEGRGQPILYYLDSSGSVLTFKDWATAAGRLDDVGTHLVLTDGDRAALEFKALMDDDSDSGCDAPSDLPVVTLDQLPARQAPKGAYTPLSGAWST